MDADARIQPNHATQPSSSVPPVRVMAAGSSVVLLRPRRLRGTIGIVRRRMPGGWEVEIRSPEGTPLHLTLTERSLFLR